MIRGLIWMVAFFFMGWGAPVASSQTAADPPQTLPRSVVAGREAQLIGRLQQELHPPAADEDPQRVQRRLDQLADDAANLAAVTDSSTLKFETLSVRLQALYLRVQRFPTEAGNSQRLAQLRQAARQLKAVNHAEALAVGDFWLTTAELHEIRHSDLPLGQKQRQSEQVLRSFITVHNSGPTVEAARGALRRLMEQGVALAEPQESAVGAHPSPLRSAGGEPAVPAVYELGPRRQTDGVVQVPIQCRYQSGPNILNILEPSALAPSPPQLRFLLVLPAEAGEGRDFGDPLQTIRDLNLHEQYGLVVVYPTLSDTPWYADHPTNVQLRQASYITRGVLPALKRLYPAARHQVLTLGFDRSGWGAVSMLLQSPLDFDAVAVWDAPLMLSSHEQLGMQQLFPNQAHFNQHRLVNQLPTAARVLKRQKRLALLGHDYFRDHLERFHTLLTSMEIPHDYIDGPARRHRWDSGWIEQAVETLVAMVDAGSQPTATVAP